MEEKKISDIPGVGSVTEEKLKEAGYINLISVAASSPSELSEVTGLSEKMCRKIINEARNMLDLGFVDGDEYEQQKSERYLLKTGYKPLDDLLGGGIESGGITEFYGKWGSKKSNMCFLYSVTPQLTDPDAITIFIDTEGSVSGQRIKDFAEGYGLDPDKALKQVKISRSYSFDHEDLLVDKALEMLTKGENIKLLIIDSLTSHLRVEFQARGTLASRQQKLNKLLHKLIKISDIYKVPVIVTNQVMADPSGFGYGDPIKPVGGEILGHMVSTRLYIKRGRKGNTVVKLVDSPYLPDGEVEFFLGKNKIEEPNW